MSKFADAETVSGEFIESARAAVARGEDLQTLGMAHLRTAMVLLSLASPTAGQALAQAVEQAGQTLGLVADLAKGGKAG